RDFGLRRGGVGRDGTPSTACPPAAMDGGGLVAACSGGASTCRLWVLGLYHLLSECSRSRGSGKGTAAGSRPAATVSRVTVSGVNVSGAALAGIALAPGQPAACCAGAMAAAGGCPIERAACKGERVA